jgi:hypothetical protein
MSYQTGTVVNLNDLLEAFQTFLAAAGWSIDASWHEPMFTNSTSPPLTSHWRYGKRLFVSKGSKFIAMQDFYLTPSARYGTFPAGANVGPGIAMIAGSGFNPVGLGNDAAHPLSGYDNIGPSTTSTFQGDVNSIPVSAPNPGTGNVPRVVIMPLSSVTGQVTGTWRALEPMVPPTDGIGAAPFTVPQQYWFFADATGDNVVMVCRGDWPAPLVRKTSYLFFGDIIKSGTWTGGVYYGASHCSDSAFSVGLPVRFGPPACVCDGIPTFLVRADVDTTVGTWPSITNNATDPGTGRRLTSSTLMYTLPGDNFGRSGSVLIKANYDQLGRKTSSIANAAINLPTKIWVERNTGLFSHLGDLPGIFQCDTTAWSFGSEALSADGSTVVIFDGFSVLKTP